MVIVLIVVLLARPGLQLVQQPMVRMAHMVIHVDLATAAAAAAAAAVPTAASEAGLTLLHVAANVLEMADISVITVFMAQLQLLQIQLSAIPIQMEM